MTGAGPSAFIGESLAPWLTRLLDRPVEAVATTDIVSAPGRYLRDAPTLLVYTAEARRGEVRQFSSAA